MYNRGARSLVVAVVFFLALAESAAAQEGPQNCAEDRTVCSSADGDGMVVSIEGVGKGEQVDGRPRSWQLSPLRRETRYIPSCDGGTAEADVGLCLGATTTCPEPGQVRFWVYTRVVDTGVTGQPPPFVLVTNPPFVCLGADDPRVDPTVAIPAIIDRDFKRIVVLKGVAKVTPAPDTLVNVETRVATDAPPSYEIPLTVLGQSVVITASAVTWTWHFGDGTQQRLTDGSSGGSTVHEYRKSGPHAAYVVIEWTGTYVIGGDPTVRQVNGTATTIGDPTQIAVRTARSELVDQPG